MMDFETAWRLSTETDRSPDGNTVGATVGRSLRAEIERLRTVVDAKDHELMFQARELGVRADRMMTLAYERDAARAEPDVLRAQVVALRERFDGVDERVREMLYPQPSPAMPTIDDVRGWLSGYESPPCDCCASPPLCSLSSLREHAPGIARLAVEAHDREAVMRAVVEAVRHERKARAEWLATAPTCAAVPAALVEAEDATGAALGALAGGLP